MVIIPLAAALHRIRICGLVSLATCTCICVAGTSSRSREVYLLEGVNGPLNAGMHPRLR